MHKQKNENESFQRRKMKKYGLNMLICFLFELKILFLKTICKRVYSNLQRVCLELYLSPSSFSLIWQQIQNFSVPNLLLRGDF